MHGLGHFYLSWGLLVQAFALLHFLRRRPESYWFFVILFFGWLGAAVYIVAEVIPDLGLLRDTMQGFGRRSRIQKVETDILDNPSAANYEELGELYKDQRDYAKGREAFTHAISARSENYLISGNIGNLRTAPACGNSTDLKDRNSSRLIGVQ